MFFNEYVTAFITIVKHLIKKKNGFYVNVDITFIDLELVILLYYSNNSQLCYCGFKIFQFSFIYIHNNIYFITYKLFQRINNI